MNDITAQTRVFKQKSRCGRLFLGLGPMVSVCAGGARAAVAACADGVTKRSRAVDRDGNAKLSVWEPHKPTVQGTEPPVAMPLFIAK